MKNRERQAISESGSRAPRPKVQAPPDSQIGASPAGDILDELRASWMRSYRGGDFDFSEFVSGITIIDQLITREFKRFVTSKFDMSPGDVRILLALRRAGPEQSLRPTDLFKRLLITSGAITKQVDRLEARGFVQRVFNTENKRGWLVVLTESGRAITDEVATAPRMSTARDVFYSLSDTQRAETLRILHLLVREIQVRTRDNPID